MVFFTDSFWPNKDGVAISTYKLAEDLIKAGNSVTIVTLGKKNEVINYNKMLIIYLKAKEFSLYPDYKILLFPPLKLLMEYIDFNEVDLIHVQSHVSLGFPAYLYSRTYNIPLIATFHTMLPEFAKQYIEKEKKTTFDRVIRKIGITKALGYIIEKLGWRWLLSYYKLSDVVITPSEFSREKLKQLGVKRLTRIYNGIVKQKSESIKLIRNKYKLNKKFVVLHVGRLSPEKRVDVAIKAFKQADIKNSVLMIASKGPQREELENLAKELGIKEKVIFTGYVSNDELAALYKECNVFITPAAFETFNLSAADALLHKKPIICAASGGHKDFVKNNYNGFLIKRDGDEIKNYADKLNEIYLKKELRKRFGENSGKMAQKLSYKDMLKNYLEVYRNMKNKKPLKKPEEIGNFTEYLIMNYFFLVIAYIASSFNKWLNQ